MNRTACLSTLAAAALLLAACGTTAGEPEALATSSEGLMTCTASCPYPKWSGIPISCTATTCSSTTSILTCDGYTFFCRTPSGSCFFYPSCSSSSTCETFCGGPGLGMCLNGCCGCQ